MKFPHIERHSIGWRMGNGEDYWHSFWRWYIGLSRKQKQAYRAKHPEPSEVEGAPWTGVYDFMEQNW